MNAVGGGSFGEMRLDELLEALSSAAPTPGGGGAAVLAVALSASLCAMAARLSTRQMTQASDLAAEALSLREVLAPLGDQDAHDYLAVIAARQDHDRTSSDGDRRQRITDALSGATQVPMEVMAVGTRLAEMAAVLVEEGNPNLRGDALTAAVLAGAGVEAAATLARVNLAGRPDDERQEVVRARLDETTRWVQRARSAAAVDNP